MWDVKSSEEAVDILRKSVFSKSESDRSLDEVRSGLEDLAD